MSPGQTKNVAGMPSARGAGRSGEFRERDEVEYAPQVAELPLERRGAAKRRTVAKKDGVLALLHRARLADAQPIHDGRWCSQQHSHDSHLSLDRSTHDPGRAHVCA
jgi:hypothetical protein